MPDDLHPHTSTIDILGGSAAVARLCQVRSQAVSQWRRRGIPPARLAYLRLLRPEAFADQRRGAAELGA